jgi:hypothetical protein
VSFAFLQLMTESLAAFENCTKAFQLSLLLKMVSLLNVVYGVLRSIICLAPCELFCPAYVAGIMCRCGVI